jgi:hypothetical protein
MLIPAMPVGATLAAERLAAGWVATGVLVILVLHLELIELDRRYKDNVKGGCLLHTVFCDRQEPQKCSSLREEAMAGWDQGQRRVCVQQHKQLSKL